MTPSLEHPDLAAPQIAGMTVVERLDLGRPFKRLEVLGDASLLSRKGVGVVGARSTPFAAIRWARALGEGLAQAGEIVVSGGAIGIDGAAHEGALDGRGQTVAVLGTGVDVPYPQRHRPLFGRIVAQAGALVSPFPSGTPVRRHNFPARNPLIAALSRAIVVVEANVRSGSLSTAAAAKKLGIPLYVRAGSAGCDLLIAGGATPVPDVASALALLAGRTIAPRPTTPVLAALSVPQTPDALAELLGKGLDDTLLLLLELEMEGRIIRLPDGRCLALRLASDTKE